MGYGEVASGVCGKDLLWVGELTAHPLHLLLGADPAQRTMGQWAAEEQSRDNWKWTPST